MLEAGRGPMQKYMFSSLSSKPFPIKMRLAMEHEQISDTLCMVGYSCPRKLAFDEMDEKKRENIHDTFQSGINKHTKMHDIGQPTNKYKVQAIAQQCILFEQIVNSIRKETKQKQISLQQFPTDPKGACLCRTI